MKKIIKILIIFVIFASNLSVNASFDEIKESIITNEEELLTGSASDILGDTLVTPDIDFIDESINIFNRAKNYFQDIFKNSISIMIKILIIVVISRVFIGFMLDNEINNSDIYINMVSVIAISILVLSDVRSVMALCSTAIYDIDMLSKGLMPSLVTAISASGAPTTGVLTYALTMFVFDILITFMSRVLFPFIYIFLAVVTVNSALGSDILQKVAEFIKWISFLILKVILTLFVTYISVSGVVTGSADAFAVKTTKLAVSSAIPLVGSLLSDASETLLVGANIIKNAIGIFGILALVSIVIIPVLQIFTNFIIFKLTTVVVSPIATKSMTGLLDGITQAYNLALAMISSCFLVFFVMLVASIILVR